MLTYEFGAYRDPTDPACERVQTTRGSKRDLLRKVGAADEASPEAAAALSPDSSLHGGGGVSERSITPSSVSPSSNPSPLKQQTPGTAAGGGVSPSSGGGGGSGGSVLSPFPTHEHDMDATGIPPPLFGINLPTFDGGDKSLYLFSWRSKFRQSCAQIELHPYFESVILVLIVISTIALFVDMPHLTSDHPLRLAISALNWFLTFVFIGEALLKIVVHGLLFSKTPKRFVKVATPYLRDGWSQLDAMIVCISIIILFDISGVDGLRAFRALRPLRLVSRYEDLKVTVDTMAASVMAMSSVLAVALLFFTVFAILGLEVFGGKFGYCADPLYSDDTYGNQMPFMSNRVVPGLSADGQTDYAECMALPKYNLTRRTTDGVLLTDMADLYPDAVPNWLDFVEFPQWLQPQFGSFDNIGHSLLQLFEISALEGWPSVLYWAMDTDSQNMLVEPWPVDTSQNMGLGGTQSPMQSHQTNAWIAGAFFILWIVFGYFILVNLMIGVVVDSFQDIKEENNGLVLMSDEEADWVRTQKQAIISRPLVQATPPEHPTRLWCYQLVISHRFEIGIMSVILLNMLQMCCDWNEPSVNAPYMADLKRAVAYINILFLIIYFFEMILKWIGLGFKQYFCDPWNCFDGILVFVSLFDVITTFLSGSVQLPFPAGVIRVLRLFRVVRVLRLIKGAKNMRTIMMTVYISIPQFKNILILLLLVNIIVDVICVNVFSFVNYTPGNLEFDYNHSSAWVWGGVTYSGGTDSSVSTYLMNAAERGEVYDATDFHFSGDGTNWGDSINRHANFQYAWTGFMVLTRASTGEGYNGLMHDLYGMEWGHNRLTCCPQCGPIIDPTNDGLPITIPSTNKTIMGGRNIPQSSCGQTFVAIIVYLVFQMIVAYIVLSIMIGVIIENFSNIGGNESKISFDDVEAFRETWLKYDPQGSFSTPSYNILGILSNTPPPLGVKGQKPPKARAEMLKLVQKMNLPDHNGQIHFNETLTCLCAFVADEKGLMVPVPECEVVLKVQREQAKVPNLTGLEHASHNTYTNYVLSLLQARFRAYEQRQKAKETAGRMGFLSKKGSRSSSGGGSPHRDGSGGMVQACLLCPIIFPWTLRL